MGRPSAVGRPKLVHLLEANEVLIHPFVVGEIALAILPRRNLTLDGLRLLPKVLVATHDEVLVFIERHRLFGEGIGYIDVHLLAAASLTAGTRLWTRDKSLRNIAERLALAAEPGN
jgi:hypothetical protein